MVRYYPRWGRPFWDPIHREWRVHRILGASKIRTHRIVPLGTRWQRKHR